MSFTILGLADAFPPHPLSQDNALQAIVVAQDLTDAEARSLSILYRKSGVRERRSVLLGADLHAAQGVGGFYRARQSSHDRGPSTRARMEIYEREAGNLAARAAVGALREAAQEDASLDRDRITHVITVSCTGCASPGVDQQLVRTLELPRTAARCHVGFMGCHGAFNALRVADAFCTADASARVLVVAVELCTLHFSYAGKPQTDVANALFGDGAAAIVCGPAMPGGRSPWSAAAFGSWLFPDSREDMRWRIGDNGFEMELSPRIPALIRAELRPWIEPWLAARGMTLDAIASWALHPGGPRILTAVEESLELPPCAAAVSRQVLAQVGNVSSPTILCILNRLRQSHAPRPCVALGFGPGLVAEAVLWV